MKKNTQLAVTWSYQRSRREVADSGQGELPAHARCGSQTDIESINTGLGAAGCSHSHHASHDERYAAVRYFTFCLAFSAAFALALIFRALRGRALLRPLSTAMIPSSEDSAPLPSTLSSSDEDSSSSLCGVLLRFLLGAGLGLGAALAAGWTAGFLAAGLAIPFAAGRLALPFSAVL